MSLDIRSLTKEQLIDKYFEQEKLITKLNNKIDYLSNELSLSNNLFENSPTPMWEEDITDLMNHIENIKQNGISNFREYFNDNPNELNACIKKIKPIKVNSAAVKLHKAKSRDELLNNFDQVFIEEAMGVFTDEIVAIANGETSFICLTNAKTLNGEILDLKLYLQITKSSLKFTAIVATFNITEQKQTEEKLLRNEKAFRTILDATDDIAILLDPNGFILES
ncbi:MAG: hypothetical protein OQJ81_10790, partial [Melioribacteraceae bacterium]|nr:hypothetical protein [Melioribacteraceae bacterium]